MSERCGEGSLCPNLPSYFIAQSLAFTELIVALTYEFRPEKFLQGIGHRTSVEEKYQMNKVRGEA